MSRFKILIIAIFTVVVVPVAAMPMFAKISRDACGVPTKVIGDVDRGYRVVGTWSGMTQLVNESAASWKSRYPNPYDAWCESKVYRLKQNVRVKINTVTEVDRNVEHYLFARQFVGERSWYLKPLFYFSATVSIAYYSFAKWVLGDAGSPPTVAEFYHAQRGAYHGLWD